MRIHAIACAAISIAVATGCSAELREHPSLEDPTNVAAAEATFRRPPSYDPAKRNAP